MKKTLSHFTCFSLTALLFLTACNSNKPSSGDAPSANITDTTQTLTQDTTQTDSTVAAIDTTVTPPKDTIAATPPKQEKPVTVKETPKPKTTPSPKPKTESPKLGASAPAQTLLPKVVFNKWRLDTDTPERADGGRTYRPDGTREIKGARMWSVIDIRENGTINIKEPGPVDAGVGLTGKWKATSSKEIIITLTDGSKRKYTILSSSKDELIIKQIGL